MIGETGDRGQLLECLLTKVLYVCKKNNVNIQIVAMSATIPNIKEISQWLNANLYISDYRPVPLMEYLKIENEIYDVNMNKIRDLPEKKKDPDHLATLCEEIIPKDSVLIFCSSKKECETTALQLTHLLSSDLKNHKNEEKTQVISELKALMTIDDILEKTIPFGIAYHHSGLTNEEKQYIEDAYRKKIISILCCTSTLAAGVNLPAKRVLFKTPYIGKDFLTKSRYKQMSGRAGRAGIDKYGESFLFLVKKNKENEKGVKLVQDIMEDTKSQLNKTGIQKLILDLVCFGFIKNFEDIKEIHSMTFCKNIDMNVYKNEFQFLIDEKFIKIKDKMKDSDSQIVDEIIGYEPTAFGEATFKSSFSMEESIFVCEELKKSQENGLVLSDELHLCYLVTPIGIKIDPNWNVLYQIYNSLPTSRINITKRIELSEEFLFMMAMERGRKIIKEEEKIEEMKSKRFFFALLLCDLVNEKSIIDVEEKYKVNRGNIQQIMENSSMFASMMVKFCERNGWSLLQSILSNYSKRLISGVKSDALELIEIDGIGSKRARSLLNAGYKDIKSIAMEDPKILVEKLNKRLGPYPLPTAQKIIENAKKFLQRKSKLIKIQLEEMELLSNEQKLD